MGGSAETLNFLLTTDSTAAVDQLHRIAAPQVWVCNPGCWQLQTSSDDEVKTVFDKDRFIQDCINALPEGQGAVREVVKEAVCDSARVMAALGEPEHAGLTPIYRSRDLTIINFAWAPCMSLMPHNHQMYSVVGLYSGREDNVFWRRTETTIEAAGARSLGVGDAAALGRDIIHSVLNPIGKMTCALHVYGGDFFQPEEPRSEWDHETLIERPWDMDKVRLLFQEADARFKATRH